MKAKIPRNNSQVSEGGITVKPGKDSTHEFIIWKVNPFVPSVTCTWYQIAFQGSVNFWLQLFSIQWDENYFSGWNCYLQHSSNLRKLSWLKFHNELMCLFTTPCPSENADWNQQQLMDGCILTSRNRANYPYCFLIQSETSPDFGFLACDLWRIVSCPPPKNRLQRWRERAWLQARENHVDAILKKIASGNLSIPVCPRYLPCHLLQPGPITFWQLLWCYGVSCLWGIR